MKSVTACPLWWGVGADAEFPLLGVGKSEEWKSGWVHVRIQWLQRGMRMSAAGL